MSVRTGRGATFLDTAAHEAMMAGYAWALRQRWLQEAREAKGDLAFLRASRIANAIEFHRKMMASIRAARKAGAK